MRYSWWLRLPVAATLMCLIVVSATAPSSAAAPAGLPSHSSIVRAAKAAADYYRPTFAVTTLTPRNGWSWSTYFQGVQALSRHAGDTRYHADGMAWGRANSWQVTNQETNPDTIKAGEVYFDLNQRDPAASLSAMDARMAADLTGLPLSRYDWIDALFMGLPDWALWARRTGDPAYLQKMDDFYFWTRDRGGTSARCAGRTVPQPGLFDAATSLWYRDCTFVGVRDVNGQLIFWGRGNGWVLAALADVLQRLPSGDPRRAKYADMLRTMARALVPLQGADGLWRASLHNPRLHPTPETSGTGLITYALAAGIRSGDLDSATYLPVVARAWQGLSSMSLRPSGFVTNCQPMGIGPAASYTATAPRTAPTSTSAGTLHSDSPPFCVGAFLLAATAVADLIDSPAKGRPVTFTGQQTGNEARRVNDGDVTTRWSASGFPQAVTVDLGTVQPVANSMLVPYGDRAYRYRIESSTDQATWRMLVDRSTNTSPGSRLDDFATVSARYVRLTVVGVSADPTNYVSIQEFAVYPPPSPGTRVLHASDAYNRTVTGGLGSAEVGGVYTLSGPGTGFSVSNGAARLRLPSPGTSLAARLGGVSVRDIDVRVDSTLDRSPTGGGTYTGLAARRVSGGEYRAKVRRESTGTVTLSVVRVVSGTETTLASQVVAGLQPAPNETLRIRFAVTGAGPATARAKVWRLVGQEPSSWQVTATDATAALAGPGAVGFWAYVSGSATNTPVTVSFDDLVAGAG